MVARNINQRKVKEAMTARTGRIAPHEHREVQLVLGGLKPLAVIEKHKDPIGYSIATALSKVGLLSVCFIRESRDSPEGEVVVVRRHCEHLIEQYNSLQSDGVKRLGIKEYHRQMGKLFGYSDEDIEKFIQNNIECNCSKCRGN